MASIDLKGAYYSVPINYVRIIKNSLSLNGRESYQFVCFPNGLALCPRKFTKLQKPVFSSLRQQGHISVVVFNRQFMVDSRQFQPICTMSLIQSGCLTKFL